MRLVKQIHISKSHPLFDECDRICFYSKNLYNVGLYKIKQLWNTDKKYFNYYDLYKTLAADNQIDYRSLPQNVSSATLLQLHDNMKSFFSANREFHKNPNKFSGPPKLPKFLDKTKGRFVAIFTINVIPKKPFKKGYLALTGTKISLPTPNIEYSQIKQVRIVPKINYYNIEIVFEQPCSPPIISDNYCGIDLGLNNVATLGFNTNKVPPLIINGNSLKSINQFYNKKVSHYQSKLKNKFSSKKLKKLTNKKNNKIKDGLHKSSKKIVNYLITNNISTVVIGQNKQWKTNINIGKKNNQNFVSIPHSKLVDMIKYKCELAGITVILREESYTSKCSFKDLETIRKHTTYQGNRITRGLFVSSSKFKYNADLNGALNILRKEFPNCFTNGIEGLMISPKKIEIYS